MNFRRSGELFTTPIYRSKRLHRVNTLWYFDTREGTQYGPFQTLGDARNALAVFLAQNVFEWTDEQLKADGYPGEQDGIENLVEEVIEVLRCERDFGALAAHNWMKSRLEDLESYGAGDSSTEELIALLKHTKDYGPELYDVSMFARDSA